MLQKYCKNKSERFTFNKSQAVASNLRKTKLPDNIKSNFFLFAKFNRTVYLRFNVNDQIIGSKKRKITSFFSACTKNSNQDGQHLNSNQKSSETSEIFTMTILSPLTPSVIPDLAEISNTSEWKTARKMLFNQLINKKFVSF